MQVKPTVPTVYPILFRKVFTLSLSQWPELEKAITILSSHFHDDRSLSSSAFFEKWDLSIKEIHLNIAQQIWLFLRKKISCCCDAGKSPPPSRSPHWSSPLPQRCQEPLRSSSQLHLLQFRLFSFLWRCLSSFSSQLHLLQFRFLIFSFLWRCLSSFSFF